MSLQPVERDLVTVEDAQEPHPQVGVLDFLETLGLPRTQPSFIDRLDHIGRIAVNLNFRIFPLDGLKTDDDCQEFHPVVGGQGETSGHLFPEIPAFQYDPVTSRSGIPAGRPVCVKIYHRFTLHLKSDSKHYKNKESSGNFDYICKIKGKYMHNENQSRKPVVGITQGDGNGIGYEVIIKSLADARILESFTPVIYGSSKIFGFYRKLLHNLDNMETFVINSASEARPRKVNIVNCLPDNVYVEPGQPTPESAKSAFTALERAVEDIKDGDIDVIVTAPINKRAMVNEGFGYAGHTDYLKKEFGVDEVLMFMVSDTLKVGVVTEHIPLKDVSSSISVERIVRKLRLMRLSLQRDFRVDQPKIAVLGLNPHCGDGGLLGDEEQRIILPAIRQANEEGILAFGPYSPDGYFGLGNHTRFDATLAMYHDQGLCPFKALAFETGVNFTAGLPIVRTSPDHGTAYDLAGRDAADPLSMMASIYDAIDIFRARRAYDALQAGKMPEPEKEEGPRSRRPQIA